MTERSSWQTHEEDAAPIEIRPLAYPDLPEVLAIERRVFPTPWSLAMFVLELSKQTGICLAAVERVRREDAVGAGGERLVAYLICSRYDTVWHVMNVAVDPDHRGRGIARLLFDELFAKTAEDGGRGYTLEVRVSNDAAIRLYERLGFRSKGVRRGYYTDNREDALVMWKDPLVAAPAD